jgi:hypothetical protein
MPLFGRLVEPYKSLLVVTRQAMAVQQPLAQRGLGIGVAECGRCLQSLGGMAWFPRNDVSPLLGAHALQLLERLGQRRQNRRSGHGEVVETMNENGLQLCRAL